MSVNKFNRYAIGKYTWVDEWYNKIGLANELLKLFSGRVNGEPIKNK